MQASPPGVSRGFLVGLCLLALCACDSSLEAPVNKGYCWRLGKDARGQPRFDPVSNGVGNLETCAAHLEAVAMREKLTDLTGAFQGQFIFVTPDMVQSGQRLDGARYRLFDAATRGKIDRDLRWMLQDETHGSRFAPASKPSSSDGDRGRR
jgi:hypothetical protein